MAQRFDIMAVAYTVQLRADRGLDWHATLVELWRKLVKTGSWKLVHRVFAPGPKAAVQIRGLTNDSNC